MSGTCICMYEGGYFSYTCKISQILSSIFWSKNVKIRAKYNFKNCQTVILKLVEKNQTHKAKFCFYFYLDLIIHKY
jgi:hypothetical protein